jgi:excisionase family DNA binding protein
MTEPTCPCCGQLVPVTDEKLLLVEEFADRAGIHRATAYRMVAAGDVASFKIGKSRRIPDSEVRRLLMMKTVQRPDSDEYSETPHTVAHRLGISSKTVRRLMIDGRIAHTVIDGVRRARPVDVDAYLASVREGVTS